MRLTRHDELVEAIQTALMSANTSSNHKRAEIALDALLAAVVEMEIGGLNTVVLSINPERYGKQLVIQLEEKQP